MLFTDGLVHESSIPELKGRLRVLSHSIWQTTGLPLFLSQTSPRYRGSPILVDTSLHPANTRQPGFERSRTRFRHYDRTIDGEFRRRSAGDLGNRSRRIADLQFLQTDRDRESENEEYGLAN
jgi:hypothetical protein